jgi:hypothetical protein
MNSSFTKRMMQYPSPMVDEIITIMVDPTTISGEIAGPIKFDR